VEWRWDLSLQVEFPKKNSFLFDHLGLIYKI
jgi:hypothetical protein